MTHIYARVQDQILTATIAPRLACNNRNTVKLHVEFDDSWDAISGRSAVFTTSVDPTPYEIILVDGVCTVPHEVLTYEGHLFISIIGVNSSTDLIKSTMPIMYKVLPGTPAMIVSTPTADVYHQLLTHLAIMQARLNNAESAVTVDSEVQDIRVGADGKVYATAGEAVREQFGKMTESTELHDLPIVYYSGITNRSKPLLIIDSKTGSITLGENVSYLYFNFYNSRFECNASEVSIDNGWSGQTAIYIYFNKTAKKFVFRPTPYKNTSTYFIGYIINDNPQASRCDVPFVYDGRYYYLYKSSFGRERASLVVGVQAEYKAKVDFKNKKLIFPFAPIIISNNGWTRLDSLYPNGCEISFDTVETDTYHYLVGDEVEGLKFITANEFQKYSTQHYFGWVRDGAELFDLNCRAEKVKTLSILGDSISTFTGLYTGRKRRVL